MASGAAQRGKAEGDREGHAGTAGRGEHRDTAGAAQRHRQGHQRAGIRQAVTHGAQERGH